MVTRATLAASAPEIAYGGSVTLRGRLAYASGTAVPGARVDLLTRRPGTTATTRVATLVTDSAGGVAYPARPAAHTEYLLRYAGDGAVAGATSAAVRVGVRMVVRAALSRTVAARGTAATVTGTVTPAHRGHAVHLQRWDGRAWQRVTHAGIGPGGRFSFTVRPAARGTYVYRVLKAADADHGGATTTRLTLRVT